MGVAAYNAAMPESRAHVPTPDEAAAKLLQLTREFVASTHPQRIGALTLDSQLTRDLGVDSLGRAELLLRVEQAFHCGLPERALTEAETPRDLLRLVLAATAVTAAAGGGARERATLAVSVPEADQGFPE